MDLPYLTSDRPGFGGAIKREPEDFVVEEIPAYEASGEGSHVHFEVEKRGLSTQDAIASLARALGAPRRDFGYAGLKDARALARQRFSLEHAELERVRAIELPRLRVLSASRHGNKLRVGHLAGNRFAIRVRGAERREADLEAILAVLRSRGVPNWFGEQRFGARGDTWRTGRALLAGDWAEAAAWIAGRPSLRDGPDVRRARELFESGEWERAARAWPGAYRDPIRLCRAMARERGNARRALRALDRHLLRFFVSAYQSHLFNAVLARRLERLDVLLAGDLAWIHRNGAVFRVEDPAREKPRAARFEVSPSGPLFGRRTSEASGEPGDMERAVLAEAGHAPEDFRRGGALQWQGGRRPLRVEAGELAAGFGVDEQGSFLELRFALPPGAYATALVREITKAD